MNDPCAVCKNEPANSSFRLITGVEQVRSGGGANKIINRRVHGYVGDECLAAIRNGADPLRQLSLFK